MLRTELDALPVEEKTGLPYASKVHAKDDAGTRCGVMHACGHDLHMASMLGTAEIMARSKNTWHGTLILIGQPAEETIGGAEGMIKDGLFTRFPKPDVSRGPARGNELPAGMVSITPGIYNTNADSLRITIYGKGGHGAMPHTTIDPIVIAARTILALQTIASREVKPGEMAIVTVGYIRAGTKNNIIPDQADMGLTIRTCNAGRAQASAGRDHAHHESRGGRCRGAAGATVETTKAPIQSTTTLHWQQRLRAPLEAALGKDNVVIAGPITPSEDFSFFIEQGVPGFYFSLGGADPQKFAEAKAEGDTLAFEPLSLFAPDVDPALHTGIAAEVAVLRNLLNASPAELHRVATSAQQAVRRAAMASQRPLQPWPQVTWPR